MLEGIGHEALDRLSVDTPDEQGRKLVYCSPQLVVKLAKTHDQPYVPPVFEDMTSEECLEVDAPEGVHVACHVPCFMSWGFTTESEVVSEDGAEVMAVTREHTQFEHHLMEREAAMAPKLVHTSRLS